MCSFVFYFDALFFENCTSHGLKIIFSFILQSCSCIENSVVLEQILPKHSHFMPVKTS